MRDISILLSRSEPLELLFIERGRCRYDVERPRLEALNL